MTNKESQNKQKKKKEALSKVIGFRIDNNLKEELEPLLINEESFNIFARRMIDVDRIVPPIDVSRELMAVSILEVEKSHFDSFSKIFWGMINNEDSVKAKVDFQLTNYLICLRKICHLLTVHNSNFPKSESSTRYIGNEGNDFEDKVVSGDVIFDEEIEEKNSTSSVVSFRITESLYRQLYDKAVGTESVQQLCKLMLKPNYKIQPVDLGYINLILKTERFYYSRLNSVGRALVTLQERYSGLDMKFVLIYRQMSALKFLMEESLGKHIKVVKKK
ncbi:TPA: hypothetical protein NJ631_002119 [Vibrio parahaemolyticus]|uniref:hypothetical protein n=1 Tax=Vibrio parahaemolyticus TaxID=670 RepID=UPI000944BD08|nr:hypothetical protein [Vibrio parahaemolyticus]MBE3889686.1 hypothetical protein [Vibrio parahaemolyticus]MBE3937584.1 hypothetical protein [Vibrio parahaemolyticus]MBE3993127.1 hypothetical protein [Vibrio parahaemolyticus]MDG2676995.1 hypothetical protein [Vibrio parahaemolyticus]OKY31660.1 hypothetical protein BTU71_05705 [Vibrio parahaemolyticus]